MPMKISEKKAKCTNAKGEVDYTNGEYKCPDCGAELGRESVFYFWDKKKPNLLHCAKCDIYYPFG
jgi:predicted RNA-binding Zn-ribbon protein involved in translation (DUF1610 family)